MLHGRYVKKKKCFTVGTLTMVLGMELEMELELESEMVLAWGVKLAPGVARWGQIGFRGGPGRPVGGGDRGQIGGGPRTNLFRLWLRVCTRFGTALYAVRSHFVRGLVGRCWSWR